MQDAVGCSVLTTASLGGFVDIVRLLLEHGAIVDYQDKVGWHQECISKSMQHTGVVAWGTSPFLSCEGAGTPD